MQIIFIYISTLVLLKLFLIIKVSSLISPGYTFPKFKLSILVVRISFRCNLPKDLLSKFLISSDLLLLSILLVFVSELVYICELVELFLVKFVWSPILLLS